MQWNLRMKAAERGIWKSVELRRLLGEAGLEVSAGKMSMWWATTPTTIRLEDLDVLCAVLDCTPTELLILEPEKIQQRRPRAVSAVGHEEPAPARLAPRLGRNRTLPPA